MSNAIADAVIYTAAGVPIAARQALIAGTYYVELGGKGSPWDSVQWKWNALLAVTSFTYYSSNLPNVQAGEDVTFWGGIRPWDDPLDGWHPETAITTAAIVAGTKGNVLVHVGGNCADRLLCKVVIGTGGNLRCVPREKAQEAL